MKKIYNSIRIDKFDYDIECYRVYGDEKVVALIHIDNSIEYNYKDAESCPNLKEHISNFLKSKK